MDAGLQTATAVSVVATMTMGMSSTCAGKVRQA
jgi:hypothetical protein